MGSLGRSVAVVNLGVAVVVDATAVFSCLCYAALWRSVLVMMMALKGEESKMSRCTNRMQAHNSQGTAQTGRRRVYVRVGNKDVKPN
eukprot:2735247-Amphidinium_carterae.3